MNLNLFISIVPAVAHCASSNKHRDNPKATTKAHEETLCQNKAREHKNIIAYVKLFSHNFQNFTVSILLFMNSTRIPEFCQVFLTIVWTA